jgi:hypothetical protein
MINGSYRLGLKKVSSKKEDWKRTATGVCVYIAVRSLSLPMAVFDAIKALEIGVIKDHSSTFGSQFILLVLIRSCSSWFPRIWSLWFRVGLIGSCLVFFRSWLLWFQVCCPGSKWVVNGCIGSEWVLNPLFWHSSFQVGHLEWFLIQNWSSSFSLIFQAGFLAFGKRSQLGPCGSNKLVLIPPWSWTPGSGQLDKSDRIVSKTSWNQAHHVEVLHRSTQQYLREVQSSNWIKLEK